VSLTKLKKELLLEGSNRYTKIRRAARTVINNAIHPNDRKCSKCGYDKHIEVCHIKSIKDFDLETPISVINSLDNLMLLCPNCHWEKDYLDKVKPPRYCLDCNKNIHNKSLRCVKCAAKRNNFRYRKVERPDKETLLKLVNEFPMVKVAKMYNVSDVAIKKWCHGYGIILGDRRGHWMKIACQKANTD
jgi:hypothetical protein